MQMVMQFIEHNDVAFIKGVEPRASESKHFLGFRVTLRPSSILLIHHLSLMTQEDIHFGDPYVSNCKIGCRKKVHDVGLIILAGVFQ